MKHFSVWVKEKFNHDINFVHKPGADGVVGLKFLVASTDKNILGFTNCSSLAAAELSHNIDVNYISATRRYSTVLVSSRKNIDMNNLIAELKNTDKIYTWGHSSTVHVFQIHQFFNKVGPMSTQTLVPYKGGGQVVIDLLSSNIDFAFLAMGTVKEYISSGKLTLVASNFRIADPVYVLEENFPLWHDLSGFCIVMPMGADSEKIKQWQQWIEEYLKDPKVLAHFSTDYSKPFRPGPNEMKSIVSTMKRFIE